MRTIQCVIRPLISISLLAVTGLAQMGPQMPSIPGMWNPVIGSGASYNIQMKGHKLHVVVAIVGTEKVGETEGYWMEMSTNAAGMDIISKNLRVGNEIKRMIIQQGSRQPMEMPMEMLSRLPKSMRPEGGKGDIRKTGKFIGNESVTVQAGTFQCEHYQDTKNGNTYDIWVSSDVSPFGLVKMTGPDTSITMDKKVSNYTSKITQAPKKM